MKKVRIVHFEEKSFPGMKGRCSYVDAELCDPDAYPLNDSFLEAFNDDRIGTKEEVILKCAVLGYEIVE